MATAKQVQELLTAVHNLTQELQTVKTESGVLKQRMDSQERACTELTPMSLASGKYDGSPHKFKEFMEACIIYLTFRPQTFASDHACIAFLISNLTGNALAWATPLVTSASPLLQDYSGFTAQFKETFERQEIAFVASEQLLVIHQGNVDLLSYISRFK
ncbi:protein LDOC1-like [Ambystoma mexicanum]|uniref:protein LDOC1-like n=1 Tax=Ambystoma mexicanum TaxID=8296 RepID=UPI0037E97FDF